MTNWVIKDTILGTLWNISVIDGVVFLTPVASSTAINGNPIIADSSLLNVFWQLTASDGVLTWNLASNKSTTSIVYLFDQGLNQW